MTGDYRDAITHPPATVPQMMAGTRTVNKHPHYAAAGTVTRCRYGIALHTADKVETPDITDVGQSVCIGIEPLYGKAKGSFLFRGEGGDG